MRFSGRFFLSGAGLAVAFSLVAPLPLMAAEALTFSVKIVDKTAGKTPAVKSVVYTMTGTALRIDASGAGTDRSYIWNLGTKTVASLDNTARTYHSDSLDKIMGFVDFSQLLGQYAGNNPKDSLIQGKADRTVAGIPCRETTRIHHFKGRVVGMINGDQTITQCLADTFPGSDLYRAFQHALARLSLKSKKGPEPPVAPLSLETVRTTDYSPGFLIKLASALKLYDLSRVPGRQVEQETVQSLSTGSVPETLFAVPSAFSKESAPPSPS